MVKVLVLRKQQQIQEIEVSGHSGYDNHGRDLVCAGVSSITVGMMNALSEMTEDTCNLVMQDAYVKIHIKQQNEVTQMLVKAMLIQLQTLQESYTSYITIKDQEV
ncbi:MAG: ribosomal-processing cysteine protease Prp [Longicatena sp.]